jgi:hypothetical protein
LGAVSGGHDLVELQKLGAGTCAAIAVNGHEENRSLVLAKDTQELFIADSESFAVRKLSFNDGKV